MKVFKSIILTAIIGLSATLVLAQATEEEAITTYNEATEAASAKDYQAALDKFLRAIELGGEVGNQDIVDRSRRQVPTMHYQLAVGKYREYQSAASIESLDAAIAKFEEAQTVAAEYSDDRIGGQAARILPQLHYSKAIMLFKREDFTGADEELNIAINMNANYAKAYYQKGLVAKKLNADDIDTILNWFDRAISVAIQVNDGEIEREASESAYEELRFRGSSIVQDDPRGSMELLNRALDYNPESAEVYYRLAEASNKLTNYNEAIQYANQALEYEVGGSTDKAKMYFEIGFAQQMLNNKAEACEAFGNASFGSFKAPAEHKMEFELKCQSTNL
ncbi:MAG: hypothetical protein MI700_06675 [Balneolales bacterium]|nr:hypothetical protein [Balneolales bacterium]